MTPRPPKPGGPGQVLFHFVRYWSRRWPEGDQHAARGREVLVAEAVHALRDQGDVTVNDVAAELGIDQSNASRLIAHAVGRGILSVEPASYDARRRVVRLTRQGTALLAAAHRWQERVFDTLTADWSEAERAAFHRAMIRLLEASHRLDA